MIGSRIVERAGDAARPGRRRRCSAWPWRSRKPCASGPSLLNDGRGRPEPSALSYTRAHDPLLWQTRLNRLHEGAGVSRAKEAGRRGTQSDQAAALRRRAARAGEEGWRRGATRRSQAPGGSGGPFRREADRLAGGRRRAGAPPHHRVGRRAHTGICCGRAGEVAAAAGLSGRSSPGSEKAVGTSPTAAHSRPSWTTPARVREFRLVPSPSYARSVALSGNLSETSFTDLIQFYSISRQTAALTVVSPAGPEHDVVVFMENGEIIDARFGEMGGIDAVRRAMRLREGEFHVDLNVTAEKRTIWESPSKLLLDEMVSDDEAQNGAGNGAKAAAAGREEVLFPKTPPPSPQHRSSFSVLFASAIVAAAAVGGALWWRSQQEAAAATARQAAVATQREAEARARPAVQGVTDTEIVFGIAAPFSGPAKELGRGMKTGIDRAFAATNEAGGVNGRKLRLVALDDGYEPERTRSVMKELAGSRSGFGFIGNVGTPTAEVAAPRSRREKKVFFRARPP